jgi:endonuclease YncB( thermonuclease family)
MIRDSDPSMRRWLCSLVLAGAGFLIQGGMVFGQTAGDSSNQAGVNKSQKESEKEEEITAKVIKVIDGDSIKVRTAEGKEYEIQIEGTDAPELKQEYGKESSEALKKMVFDSDVRVSWKKKDNFDRPLAQVYRGDKHINAEMISSGNAWHFKRSKPKKRKRGCGNWKTRSHHGITERKIGLQTNLTDNQAVGTYQTASN